MTTGTMSFSVSPVWITQHVRSLWAEARYQLAFDTINCLDGLPHSVACDVIRGKKQLTDEYIWEEDDWIPNLGFCSFGQYPDPNDLYALAERGAQLDQDVERLQDMAIGLGKRLMREGYPDGSTISDIEYLLRTLPDEALERNNVAFVVGVEQVRHYIPTVEEFVAHQLELDDKPLPDPDPDLKSNNGYIIPNGQFFPCAWMDHTWLVVKLKDELGIPEDEIVKVGISQIDQETKNAWTAKEDYEPTIDQVASTVLWLKQHDGDISEWVEKGKKL